MRKVLVVTAMLLGLAGALSSAPSDAVELLAPQLVTCGGKAAFSNPPPKVHYSLGCAAKTNMAGKTYGAFVMKVNPATSDSVEDPVAVITRLFSNVDAISACSPPPPDLDCGVISGTATVTESDGTRHWNVPFQAAVVEGGPGVGVVSISLDSSDLDGAPGDLTAGDSNYDTTLDLSDGVLNVAFLFLGGPPG